MQLALLPSAIAMLQDRRAELNEMNDKVHLVPYEVFLSRVGYWLYHRFPAFDAAVDRDWGRSEWRRIERAWK